MFRAILESVPDAPLRVISIAKYMACRGGMPVGGGVILNQNGMDSYSATIPYTVSFFCDDMTYDKVDMEHLMDCQKEVEDTNAIVIKVKAKMAVIRVDYGSHEKMITIWICNGRNIDWRNNGAMGWDSMIIWTAGGKMGAMANGLGYQMKLMLAESVRLGRIGKAADPHFLIMTASRDLGSAIEQEVREGDEEGASVWMSPVEHGIQWKYT